MANKPIKPTILLDAGAHNTWIQRSGSSPAIIGTCHHIVPYRYLSFTGYLIEQYLATQPGNDRLSGREERILNIMLTDRRLSASDGNLAVRLAWITPNLFEGPAPGLRADDPGNDYEKNRPVTMTQDRRWQDLQVIRGEIDGMATLSMKGNRSRAMDTWTSLYATAKRDIGVQDLGRLLIHFEPLVKNPHVHRFQADDWILMAPKGAPGWFNPTQEFTSDVRERYRWLYLRKLVEYYMPRMAGAPDLRPYLWRLRLEFGDPAPPIGDCPRVQNPRLRGPG